MMTFQNGEVYCGSWLNDLRHGDGALLTTTRTSFRFTFNFGKGVHTFVDGSRYEGVWEQDMLHGKGIFYYSDGSVFAGQFDSNKRHGQGVTSTRIVWLFSMSRFSRIVMLLLFLSPVTCPCV